MPAAAATIEIRLSNPQQLFNSLDPSPFHERDLDEDAEAYIVDSADEYPLDQPLTLVIYLPPDYSAKSRPDLGSGIHHYFAYRAEETRRRLRIFFREGRTALIVGGDLPVRLHRAASAGPHDHPRTPRADRRRRPLHRGMGRDVAPARAVSVRLAPDPAAWAPLRQAGRDSGHDTVVSRVGRQARAPHEQSMAPGTGADYTTRAMTQGSA
jgi:hypothetical protein